MNFGFDQADQSNRLEQKITNSILHKSLSNACVFGG